MVNRVILVGRLGRDPEMRYTPGGIPVCSFSVACDSGYGDSKKTVWFRVSAWRRLAETCNEYLAKGRLAYVEGVLSEPRAYQAKDGEWRASLDVAATAVRFLTPKAAEAAAEDGALTDESIPF